MHDCRADSRKIDMCVFGMVPLGVVPPQRLSGADEDDDGSTIVRGID